MGRSTWNVLLEGFVWICTFGFVVAIAVLAFVDLTSAKEPTPSPTVIIVDEREIECVSQATDAVADSKPVRVKKKLKDWVAMPKGQFQELMRQVSRVEWAEPVDETKKENHHNGK